MKTEVLFLNHAFVLIRYGKDFMLCDPWFQRPSCGSWLPVPPTYIHPAYLVALQKHARILISHAHNDHFDTDFLDLFEKDTQTYSANFLSPSVKNRLNSMGFAKHQEVDRNGLTDGPFTIKSYIDYEFGLDDALYTIETPDAIILHCNDFSDRPVDEIMSMIKSDIDCSKNKTTLYMAQNNAASSYPFSYQAFSDDEIISRTKESRDSKIISGMNTASELGVEFYFPYAGYSGFFLKHNEQLLDNIVTPSYKYIQQFLSDQIPDSLNIVDMLPGDYFDCQQKQTIKAFFSDMLEDKPLQQATINYYKQYNIIDQCVTYQPAFENISNAYVKERLIHLLLELEKFTLNVIDKTAHYSSIIGKILCIDVPDINLTLSLKFGSGLIESSNYNEKMTVESKILIYVFKGINGLEDITGGGLATFDRDPIDIYNRDIWQYIPYFSGYYKDNLSDMVTN